jgi:hypothetical protein
MVSRLGAGFFLAVFGLAVLFRLRSAGFEFIQR